MSEILTVHHERLNSLNGVKKGTALLVIRADGSGPERVEYDGKPESLADAQVVALAELPEPDTEE